MIFDQEFCFIKYDPMEHFMNYSSTSEDDIIIDSTEFEYVKASP